MALVAALLLAVGATASGQAASPATEAEAPEPEESNQATPGQPPPAEAPLFKCQDGSAGPFPCKNVDVESIVPLGGAGAGNGNDVWGWTDPQTKKEYALVGSALQTTFIDVTDPQNPRTVGSLPTSGIPDFVLWRDIKVDGNYAFIVAEVTDHGMQVFDLTRLRDAGPTPQVFTADAVYQGADEEGEELSNAHNVAINEETNFAYVVGSNTCVSPDPDGENGGLHMVDISDPKNPRFAGCALVTDPASNNYIHDVQCVIYRGPDADYRGREICFGANEAVVTIYDVTDKDNPVVISQTAYGPASYTHQGWLKEDHSFFLFGDELDEQGGTVENTTTYIMSTSDLDNPGLPKAFSHDTTSIDHNLYAVENRVYASNYGAGLRVLDFTNSSLANGQLNEVGYLDIRPGFDEPEFVGTWSNYPYFDSGIVVMTGIEEGSTVLYVLRPTGKAAGTTGGGGGGGGGNQNGNENGNDRDRDDRDRDSGSGEPGSDGTPQQRGAGTASDVEGGALALTGAQLMFLPLLGVALIAAGAGVQRRRRRRSRSRAEDFPLSGTSDRNS